MPTPQYVLVIDQDPHMRQTLRSMIRVSGYQCLMAETSQAALEQAVAHQQSIAGVLIDPALAGPPAHEFVRTLRRLISGPFIFVSSAPASEVARQVRRSNIIFLGKPFDLADLREALGLIFARPAGSSASQAEPIRPPAPAPTPVPAPILDDLHPLANLSAHELEELWAE